MKANPFARLETLCANAVERTFAFAFPSALQPVQIARKLVAAFEASGFERGETSSLPSERHGRSFIVRVHPSDYARLENDVPYLERQWTTMLVRLSERSGRPQRSPEVRVERDPAVAPGTIAIAMEARAPAQRLLLRVRRGVELGREFPLAATLVIGRDPACDAVLVDARVSRRHCAVESHDGVAHVRDLGSSNGTRLNGAPVSRAALGCGDVLGVGESELVVDACDDGRPR